MAGIKKNGHACTLHSQEGEGGRAEEVLQMSGQDGCTCGQAAASSTAAAPRSLSKTAAADAAGTRQGCPAETPGRCRRSCCPTRAGNTPSKTASFWRRAPPCPFAQPLRASPDFPPVSQRVERGAAGGDARADEWVAAAAGRHQFALRLVHLEELKKGYKQVCG